MGRFVVTQMAAVAELEAGLISERTTHSERNDSRNHTYQCVEEVL